MMLGLVVVMWAAVGLVDLQRMGYILAAEVAKLHRWAVEAVEAENRTVFSVEEFLPEVDLRRMQQMDSLAAVAVVAVVQRNRLVAAWVGWRIGRYLVRSRTEVEVKSRTSPHSLSLYLFHHQVVAESSHDVFSFLVQLGQQDYMP
jgi:hypothetical protein